MKNAKNSPTPEDVCARFAAAAPIGTPCIYFPAKPFDRAKAIESKIRSAPWALGHGAVVVAIEGKAGGVSIDHIAFDVPSATHS